MGKRVIESFEHTTKYLAVLRSNGDTVQFPDATGYEIDDVTDDLRILSDTTDLRQIALFRDREWVGVLFPGARRLVEVTFGRSYDAEGNEVDASDDDELL